MIFTACLYLFTNSKAMQSDLIGLAYPIDSDIQVSFHTDKACRTLRKVRKYEVGGGEDEHSEL